MNSSDLIEYSIEGFESDKYLNLQKDKILERIDLFRDGKLYLEIGGKFLYDPHAARVLPGFDPFVKKNIFQSLKSMIDLLFCVNAQDIRTNRALKNSDIGYVDAVTEIALDLQKQLDITPKIIINLCDRRLKDATIQFEEKMQELGFKTYKRYMIDGYPSDTSTVLSENGYGFDDYIDTNKKLILVTGAASNSGKMSTCLGQIYIDHTKDIRSGYAKYETFPIWSLPISHPVNLAYEAATADIGDFNVIDTYHEKAYGKRSVNYNRDVEAFEIIMNLSKSFLDDTNHMKNYKSPTDMGINYAGSAITDDQVVCVASLGEVRRRKDWYNEVVQRGEGKKEWVEKCNKLEIQAMKYIKQQGYNPDFKLF